ncbi:hypothetical protein Tco_0894994 [Tanacetum coccineum]|uniref:Uncharacterized protein n=1 Tax=Tanacetum coccineum TaxID=301880 RepID=A0ABQ5CET3_9ASTR
MLGLWRGLRECLCLLGDIVLDSEYADSCALVLFFRLSPKSRLSLLFTSSAFLSFLLHTQLIRMIGKVVFLVAFTDSSRSTSGCSSAEPWGCLLVFPIVFRYIRPWMALGGRLFVMCSWPMDAAREGGYPEIMLRSESNVQQVCQRMSGMGSLSGKGPRVIVFADASVLPRSVFVRGDATGAALKTLTCVFGISGA